MKQISTVVSMGLSRTSNGDVNISISDAHSSDRIMVISMSVAELGLLVTGLHGVKGVAEVFDANIAKKRVTESVLIDCITRGDAKHLVEEDYIRNYAPDGWFLHDNGIGTQQRVQNKHRYVIKRYIEVEDILEVERYY